MNSSCCDVAIIERDGTRVCASCGRPLSAGGHPLRERATGPAHRVPKPGEPVITYASVQEMKAAPIRLSEAEAEIFNAAKGRRVRGHATPLPVSEPTTTDQNDGGPDAR